jgi:DNA repair exonuclease SbcCD ATPase subunit
MVQTKRTTAEITATMEKNQYKVIIEELRDVKAKIQETRDEAGRIDRDLTKDRHDLEDFRVRLGRVEEEIQSLKRLLTENVETMKDKVQDALKPAVKEVASLKQEIAKKRSIIVTKNSLIDWIKGVFGKKGGEEKK